MLAMINFSLTTLIPCVPRAQKREHTHTSGDSVGREKNLQDTAGLDVDSVSQEPSGARHRDYITNTHRQILKQLQSFTQTQKTPETKGNSASDTLVGLVNGDGEGSASGR